MLTALRTVSTQSGGGVGVGGVVGLKSFAFQHLRRPYESLASLGRHARKRPKKRESRGSHGVRLE